MYKLLLPFLFTAITASAQETLLLRSPSVSDTKIAFAYGGDIWSADRDGSHPQRLTVNTCRGNKSHAFHRMVNGLHSAVITMVMKMYILYHQQEVLQKD